MYKKKKLIKKNSWHPLLNKNKGHEIKIREKIWK